LNRASEAGRVDLILFGVILFVGCLLRLVALGTMPLHGDEAVGAMVSRDVRETGSFEYRSANRHGPFQYYRGGAAMTVLGESDTAIRFPYAVSGCLLVAAALGLRRRMPEGGWLVGASVLAFSPTVLYYSRYAIQEIDLALASLLLLTCGAAFAASGNGRALVGLLLAAGWMVTIKETFVILWGCLALAALLGSFLGGDGYRGALKDLCRKLRARRHAAVGGALLAAVLIAAAYTDGFRDPGGPVHLLRNLAEMLRIGAVTEAGRDLHSHPISFYLAILLRYEWPVLILAAFGAWRAFRNRPCDPFRLTIALYALITLAVHLALPYKTPWLLLTPLVALAITAGWGGAALLDAGAASWPGGTRRLAAVPLVGFLLLFQAIPASFLSPEDPSRPLAYHPTSPEQVRLAAEIRRIAEAEPEREGIRVLVALPYVWPLAWYLRDREDVVYVQAPIPPAAPDSLQGIPAIVTLDRADRRFLLAFTGAGSVPSYEVSGYRTRTYVLIAPDYTVARLFVRPDLAQEGGFR
jgi:uncharacterized protein (TIGR03663 family)